MPNIYSWALRSSLPRTNVVFYIANGKPYLSDDSFKVIFDELLHNGLHQTILLTMFYHQRVHGGEHPAGAVGLPGELYPELSKTIKALQAAGKKVILIGNVPFYRIQAHDCVYKSGKNVKKLCRMNFDEANRQKHLYIDTLKKLGKALNVEVIDIYKPLCNDRGCSMFRKDYILYRDNNHLNIRGSQLVGEYIAEQLRKAPNTRPTY